MDLNNIVNGIQKRSEKAIPVEEEDYIVDGLIYCGKCHTPKQCRIDIGGQVFEPMCLCKCMTEKRDAEDKAFRERQFAQRVRELRRYCFNAERLERWTFANDDGNNPEIMKVARNFVDKFGMFRKDGHGLVLFGSTGTGKSYACASICNALIDKGVSCRMTDFASIEKKQDLSELNRYTLLVIDDLATERDTEYMNEIVQNVINSRYENGLPLIITTNLSGKELKEAASLARKRVYSRLYEMCTFIEAKGADRRRMTQKTDAEKWKERLMA